MQISYAHNHNELTFYLIKLSLHLTLNVFFRQIKSFIRFRLAFVFGLQTIKSINLTKIDQIKGLKPKTKG